MRNSIKFMALVLALILAFSLASCTLTKTYSYKDDDVELPIGVYIYQLYSAYQSAQSYAQQSDLYDSETEKYDGSKSFLKMEITDDDGNTATADEWIANKADESMRQILAYYHEFNRLGSTIDEATLEGYQDQAKEYWEYGPYYSYYGDQYKNPYKDIFEPIGVSYDSFYLASFYPSALAEAVFNDLYGATGQEAVSDDELTKYFTDNYTSYKYFSANLYTTEQAETMADDSGITDTSSSGETVDVALSDEDIKKYNDSFEIYADAINGGASYEDVVEKYMDDFDVEEDPTQSGVNILDDSSIGEDLIAAYKEMKEGEAKTITVGEGNSAVIYLLYKAPIEDEIDSQINDENNRSTLLHNYKQDDFKDYIKKVGDDLTFEISGECKSYTPKKMEDILNKEKK